MAVIVNDAVDCPKPRPKQDRKLAGLPQNGPALVLAAAESEPEMSISCPTKSLSRVICVAFALPEASSHSSEIVLHELDW